jgi:PAS domain S-box-containing protein
MPTFHFTKKRFVIALLCTPFIVTAAGWVFTGYLVGMATRMVERELENANAVISINLTSELKRIESAATAIAGSPLTLPLLQANTPENMEKVNNILDRYHKALGAAACYLIDKNGLTLTSSNRNEKDSFVGQNYTFRSYFQQAIKGGIGHLFAYGTVSKRRGFYSSAPVKDKEGRIVGVVTIKKEIEDIETKLSQYSWFLLDQSGVIFMSSQPEARLKSLWPLSDEQQQKIILSKQYGPGPFGPVLQKPLKDKTEVTFQEGQYLASQHATPYEGISVVLLWPTGQISMYRSFGIILTLLALLLTLSFLAAIYTFTQSNSRMNTLLRESQSQAAALAGSERQLRARTDDLESQKAELLHARQAAEAARARSDTLFNASTSAHVIINSKAQIVDCNDTFLRLLGYASLEDVAGKHPAALAPPLQPDGHDSIEKGGEMVGIAIERGRHVFDWMCQNAKGEVIPVEVTIITIMLDGEPHLMGIWHDLTERKDAEEQVNAYFKSSADGLLILSPEHGFIHANQTAAAMFGFENIADLNKCSPVELSPPYQPDGRPSQEAAIEYISKAMQMDAPLRFDWIHRRKDGTDFPCEIALIRIVLAGQQHLLTNIRDITERKQMEQKIIAEGERLKGILDTAPVSIAFSTKGRIHFANPLFLETFGAKIGDASPQLYVHPEEREALIELIKRDGIAREQEIQMYDRQKRARDMLVTFLPINYDGEDGVLGWLMDITERKQAERELQEQMEELERFSHLTINREEKMIKLKQEINTLRERLGEEKKYKIVE